MKFVSIAYYAFLRQLRDYKTLLIMTAFPIALIAILGTALSNVYSPRPVSIIKVAYLSEDEGSLSREFNKFLKSDELKSIIEIVEAKSYEDGKKLVENGKTSGFIYLNKNFTSDILNGKETKIEVINNKSREYQATAIESIIESFINMFNTQVSTGLQNNKIEYSNLVSETPIDTSGKIPRAIDYYAVTMLVMTLMYGTLYGSNIVFEDKTLKTNIRISSSPIRGIVNFAAKILGTAFTLFLDTILIIIISKYVFKANWGSNIFMILLISTVFLFFTISLGILIGVIAKENRRASMILSVFVIFSTFFSGGYSKVDLSGTVFEKLQYTLPNFIGQNAYFNLIYGGNFFQYMKILLIMLIVTLILAAYLGREGYR